MHFVTVVEICFLYIVFSFLHAKGYMNSDYSLLKKLVLYPFVLMPFFPQLDAYSRYQNYKQLRDLFYLNGYNVRFIKPFIKSRCQRDAVLAAADDVGFAIHCKQYFYDCGYKWYHFFPDFVITNPQFLLCKHFWITTFFSKTYHSKVDIKLIESCRQNNIVQLAVA